MHRPILDTVTGTLCLFNGRTVRALCLDDRPAPALLCAHPRYFRLPVPNGQCTNKDTVFGLLLAHAKAHQELHDAACRDRNCPLRAHGVVAMLCSRSGMEFKPERNATEQVGWLLGQISKVFSHGRQLSDGGAAQLTECAREIEERAANDPRNNFRVSRGRS